MARLIRRCDLCMFLYVSEKPQSKTGGSSQNERVRKEEGGEILVCKHYTVKGDDVSCSY